MMLHDVRSAACNLVHACRSIIKLVSLRFAPCYLPCTLLQQLLAAMAAPDQTLTWKVGLINSASKYLTAEQFASKVNLTGTSLRKKQTWTLESVSETECALKSTYGKYLSFYRNDTADAAAEGIGGAEQKFELLTQQDGRVALKSVAHGRYLAEIGGELSGTKDLGQTNLFTLQLATHPQVNLRNSNRKTYCHLENDEIHCNEAIPWGFDAMIVLDFHEGRYALRAANGLYLSRTGDLVKDVSEDTLYVLVFKSAQVAFRDCKGKYLTAIGPYAKMQTRKDSVGKDELFTIEDSHAQMSFKASNGKLVSHQGEEIRANQTELTDNEIFQVEAVDRADQSGNVLWALRCKSGKYWSFSGAGAGIMPDKDDASDPGTHFRIEWCESYVYIRASNNRYVTVKGNGQMVATAGEPSDENRLVATLTNRTLIVLKGQFGFVGKRPGGMAVECNRSKYDLFWLECTDGLYQLKCPDGKYWHVQAGGNVVADGGPAANFSLELRAHTHMCIKAPNGEYIKGIHSGEFQASGGTSVSAATLWEY